MSEKPLNFADERSYERRIEELRLKLANDNITEKEAINQFLDLFSNLISDLAEQPNWD